MNKIQWFHSYLDLTLNHTGVPCFPQADGPAAADVWTSRGVRRCAHTDLLRALAGFPSTHHSYHVPKDHMQDLHGRMVKSQEKEDSS